MYVNMINWMWLWTTPTIPEHITYYIYNIDIHVHVIVHIHIGALPSFPFAKQQSPGELSTLTHWNGHLIAWVSEYQAEVIPHWLGGCVNSFVGMAYVLRSYNDLWWFVCIFTFTPHLYNNIIFLGAWMTIQVELTIWHLLQTSSGQHWRERVSLWWIMLPLCNFLRYRMGGNPDRSYS